MKFSKLFSVIALIIVTLSLNSLQLLAQTCVSCNSTLSNVSVGYNNNINSSWTQQSILGNNNTTSRNNAVAIGTNSTASWSHSYVFGSSSSSNGIHSYAIGSNAIAQSTYSYAIGQAAKSMFGNAFTVGNFTQSDAVGAYVFGLGVSSQIPFTNNIQNSLAIGFLSTKPTLFVSESPYSANYDRTGRIGIGNITSPQSKLHLLADFNEIAELRLEHRTSGTAQYARLLMGTHTIRAGNNENMVFTTPNTSRHFVFTNGRVGIGTTSPQQPLHVVGNALVTGNLMANTVTTITNTNLVLATNGTERMRITSTGDVAIGTTDPKGYKLAVNGKLIAEEVVVKMSGSWPDYVFRDDYQLMTVHEVESFIETHGHLPEVPNAQLIAESGISLGALNTVLVKKVEELTLYIIQQQKEIDVLKLKMASIANQ